MASDDPSTSIRTTWVISLDYVKGRGRDGENAVKLLQLFSFFNNTKIEHDIFTRPSTTEWKPFSINDLPAWFQDVTQSSLSLNRAIRMLGKYSLIQQHSTDKHSSVHPVVHEWSYYVGRKMHPNLCRTAAVIIASGAIYHSDLAVIRGGFELLPHCRRLVQILTGKPVPYGPQMALEEEVMWKALALIGVVFRQSRKPESGHGTGSVQAAIEQRQEDPGYFHLIQLWRLNKFA